MNRWLTMVILVRECGYRMGCGKEMVGVQAYVGSVMHAAAPIGLHANLVVVTSGPAAAHSQPNRVWPCKEHMHSWWLLLVSVRYEVLSLWPLPVARWCLGGRLPFVGRLRPMNFLVVLVWLVRPHLGLVWPCFLGRWHVSLPLCLVASFIGRAVGTYALILGCCVVLLNCCFGAAIGLLRTSFDWFGQASMRDYGYVQAHLSGWHMFLVVD
ncbi:hypothetical protein R6Q59_031732 [Mikania micrantha]